MATYRKTRTGRRMNKQIMRRIMAVMTQPAHDGLSQKELSKLIGIHDRTLRNYLTDEVWTDIKTLRLHAIEARIVDLDNTIFTRAMEGDLAAAKLVYARWENEKKHQQTTAESSGELPSNMALLTQEIKSLQTEISTLENKEKQEEDEGEHA